MHAIAIHKNIHPEIEESFTKHGIDVSFLESDLSPKTLISKLQEFSVNDLVLIFNPKEVLVLENADQLSSIFDDIDCDILFASQLEFQLDDEDLAYYFWKFYPRMNTSYHYLNSNMIIGNAGKLVDYFEGILTVYPNAGNFSFHDLATRHFVDQNLGVINSSVSVEIDSNQHLFGGGFGELRSIRWPMVSWIQDTLYFRLENEYLKTKPENVKQSVFKNLSIKDNRLYNRKTSSYPAVIQLPGPTIQFDFLLSKIHSRKSVNRKTTPVVALFLLWIKSLIQFLGAFIINRGTTLPGKLFRYAQNRNPSYKQTIEKFILNLENGTPYTFSHFNDGELTFIKKYLAENHKETWFGRRQQKYNKQLGERLLYAMEHQTENYHVGIPCSVSHPKLNHLAKTIVKKNSGVVPAMTFHHNLSYFPKIINQLSKNDCHFIMNDYQKLDVFEKLGVSIKMENITRVPFVNSYLLFDELKEKEFPPGAVVILMCGMLAKIIIPEWFKRNPKTTFLAFGSSFDDFIQKSNTKYTPFPSELPVTGNIFPTKFFLFGWKKHCRECYDMKIGTD